MLLANQIAPVISRHCYIECIFDASHHTAVLAFPAAFIFVLVKIVMVMAEYMV